MKNYLILLCLTAVFAVASAYAGWPETSDFASTTSNLDTKTPQTTIQLQNKAALAYNLNWGDTKAASVSIFANGLASTETASISNYEILKGSTTDGYGNTLQWDYAAKTKEELPKGAYTLSHVTYDSTPQVLQTLKCQVKLLPEPALAMMLGILCLAFLGRRPLKAVVLALLGTAAFSSSAETLVSAVNAYPRWPWNGKVDIVYTIGGNNADKWFDVAFQVKNVDTVLKMNHVEGTYAEPSSVMATDIVKGTGQHVLTWDAGSDFPDQTVENLSYYVAAKEVKEYLKINLSASPVTATEVAETDIPKPWTDDDKTKYLWLRRIPATRKARESSLPGDYFEMGSPDTEPGRYTTEKPHNVTLTKDFYIGVFELTAGQYARIIGKGAGTSCVATNFVSYNFLRGTSEGCKWPYGTDGKATELQTGVDDNSIIGKLRTLTSAATPFGYRFDLPTEAQWEYACRGPQGFGSTWNDGNKIIDTSETSGVDSNLDKLGWYTKNAIVVQNVGQKTPNGWGLYDMHGNVYEWCLDRYGLYGSSTAVEDPVGATTGNSRIVRSGSWSHEARRCRSAARGNNTPSSSDKYGGVRVALVR